jgi:hypothetical protein
MSARCRPLIPSHFKLVSASWWRCRFGPVSIALRADAVDTAANQLLENDFKSVCDVHRTLSFI